MNVFRVEHLTSGLGPYRSDIIKDFNDLTSDSRPIPSCEKWEKCFDIDGNPSCYFGFAKKEHVLNWFSEKTSELIENNFVIKQYRLPRRYVIKGKQQVAFHKDQARVVSVHKIENELKNVRTKY